MAGSMLVAVGAIHAATITVDSTSDADAADGACTLREAIQAANSDSTVNGDCVHDGTPDPDTIAFSIPGAGPHTISPLSVLPTFGEPVIIDGTTQPGASCNTWPPTLTIEIEGSGLGNLSGLIFSSAAAGSTVRGLVINRFGDSGIDSNASNSTIECNFVGTDVTGTLPLGNGFSGFLTAGVNLDSASNVLIGSNGDGVSDATERNLISANALGIRLFNSDNNVIGGNYIGPDISGIKQPGAAPFPLIQTVGVFLNPGSNNQIGTSGTDVAAAMRNLISANGSGVDISGGDGNRVAGNYIGTDLAGTGNLGNAVGVSLDPATNTFVGTNSDGNGDAAERNIISGGGSSVRILGSDNVIAGNYIGTDVTGTLPLVSTLPVVDVGIELRGADNRVGTDGDGQNDTGEGNLISGRGFVGIFVDGASTMGNTIAGNLIGTDAAGTAPLPNQNGIIMFGVDNNTLGGPLPVERNTIRFNTEEGVEFVESTGNVFQNNAVSDNGGIGVNNRGGSPTIQDNDITDNGGSGIRNAATRSNSPATPGDDLLAQPVIASNVIRGNCTGGSTDCAGIFSLDTEPASIGAAPMANNGAPFVEQRWLGVVEVIGGAGTPVAASPTIDSSNGGPSYALSQSVTCTGGVLNNTIIHGVDPGLSCDNVQTWTQFVELVTDQNGVTTVYVPQSEAGSGASYSFDGDATTDPTDSGSGFVGEGTATGPFSRYQVMELAAAVSSPALTIVKSASPTTYFSVGQVIDYSYLVTNTGNVTISDLAVSDNNVDVAPVCPVTSLAPAAATTCTAQRTVTQADLDAGSITNTATASGEDPGGAPVTSPPDSETVTALLPGLELIKDGTLDRGANGQSDPGDFIDYTLVVTNTGGVALTRVVVSDPLVVPILCPSGNPIPSLAPAVSETCTGSYEITQADIDAGERENTASANSDQAATVSSSHTEPIPQPAPPPTEIPTLGQLGLLLLMVALAGSGTLLLRR